MLFNDGEFIIYKVQHLQKDNKWVNINHDAIKLADPGKEFEEPCRSFTTCGKCWQRTGIHGCFDRKIAYAFLRQISRLNPDYEFSLTKITITQITELEVRASILEKDIISKSKLPKIGYQVLNKDGFSASNDFNWMCIFPSWEEALTWAKYIKEECDVDITDFTIRDVEVRPNYQWPTVRITDKLLDGFVTTTQPEYRAALLKKVKSLKQGS